MRGRNDGGGIGAGCRLTRSPAGSSPARAHGSLNEVVAEQFDHPEGGARVLAQKVQEIIPPNETQIG